jgi:ribosomal protein L11 methyltransferase PrmA
MPVEPTPLSPTTVLVRAPELTLRMNDADDVRIDVPGGVLHAAPLALSIVAAFAYPRSVGAVLDDLEARGQEHFIEASALVLQLFRAGVLRVPGDRGPARAEGYVAPFVQLSMLADGRRTRGFCDALRAEVRPDDVVVDIGTGTGILATCAALAGAKHVYAVESSGIAGFAERVFAANGVADRVTLVRGRSTHIELPERASVLVTEMIGNDPFDEDLLEVVLDAKKRLLSEDARIIPSRIELFARPVDVPRAILAKHAFLDEEISAYRAAYGVDLAPLAAHRIPPDQSLYIEPTEAATLTPLGDATRLVDIDLRADFDTHVRGAVESTLSRPAERLGIALPFRATLAEGIVLSPAVDEIDLESHWVIPLWPEWKHARLPAGARIAIEYCRDRGATTTTVRPLSGALAP